MSDESRPLRWRVLASHVPASGAGGGMIRYAVELISALERRPDVEVSVLAAPAAAPFFQERLADPARVVVLPALPVTGTALVEFLTRRAGSGGPVDVVHGTKHLLPLRSGATRVLTVHDLLPFDRPGDFGPVKRALLRTPYQASIARADVLACVSDATRQRLVRRFPGSAVRCGTTPLAVGRELLAATPAPVPALADRRFALVVGDDSLRKNLGMLVDTWPEVVRRDPGLALAVAGPPSWAGSSRGDAFERLVASGDVVALGRIPDGELRWCYENAAVTLCPSLLEGFGLPAIEALSLGSPLITSTDAALVEAAGDQAPHVAPDDPVAWADTIVATVGGLPRSRQTTSPATSRPARTWDDVAADTVDLVRHARSATRGGLVAAAPGHDTDPGHGRRHGR